jgi:hypothetical protein
MLTWPNVRSTGWQEIIAVADMGMTLVYSSVPAMDWSQALTTYPTDLLQSPPQVLQTQVFSRPPKVLLSQQQCQFLWYRCLPPGCYRLFCVMERHTRFPTFPCL